MLTPASVRTPEFLAELTALDVDAAAVVGYGKLLPQPVLDAPKHGWVNLHFSLLPAWRGAAPVQAAIRAGDEFTGATTFRLEAGMDTGPVYGVVTETVRPDDTAGALARAARRRRRAAVGRHPRRHRRRFAATPAAAGRGRQPGPQDQPRVRPDRLDRTRSRDRPADPLALARARGVDRLALGTVGARPRAGLRRSTGSPPANFRSSGAGCWSAPAPPRWNWANSPRPGRRAMPAADWARGARPDAGRRPGRRRCP